MTSLINYEHGVNLLDMFNRKLSDKVQRINSSLLKRLYKQDDINMKNFIGSLLLASSMLFISDSCQAGEQNGLWAEVSDLELRMPPRSKMSEEVVKSLSEMREVIPSPISVFKGQFSGTGTLKESLDHAMLACRTRIQRDPLLESQMLGLDDALRSSETAYLLSFLYESLGNKEVANHYDTRAKMRKEQETRAEQEYQVEFTNALVAKLGHEAVLPYVTEMRAFFHTDYLKTDWPEVQQ